MARNVFDENSEEESHWTFEGMMSHVVDAYATIKSLFSQYFSIGAFFVFGVFLIFLFSVCGVAMCKSCCCSSSINCGRVCCLCLNLFLIPPRWFFRYFKFIEDNEETNIQKENNFSCPEKVVITNQPAAFRFYQNRPVSNYYVENS